MKRSAVVAASDTGPQGRGKSPDRARDRGISGRGNIGNPQRRSDRSVRPSSSRDTGEETTGFCAAGYHVPVVLVSWASIMVLYLVVTLNPTVKVPEGGLNPTVKVLEGGLNPTVKVLEGGLNPTVKVSEGKRSILPSRYRRVDAQSYRQGTGGWTLNPTVKVPEGGRSILPSRYRRVFVQLSRHCMAIQVFVDPIIFLLALEKLRHAAMRLPHRFIVRFRKY
ncbi:hypothetical protein BV898_17089 [Hypsibius exemplaris]|uniref:Uncharacterized protein n=1 Tax=Hypsibius exemplaris TaxID=2072580 RepID=A0A9X6RM89_HYPEX|nr:hypothetical protein BV898_17089 [Hypsibius exemplaris]